MTFRWTKKAEDAAIALANGETRERAAVIAEVSEITLYRWLRLPEFAEEVDRLTFMTGVANKADRLRMAKRVISSIGIVTEKDLLDWLKYVMVETDGVKLDIAGILAAVAANGDEVAAGRPNGIRQPATEQASGDADQ